MRATGGLMVEPSAVADTLPQATPVKRKRGKALSRRTGQNGHIEKSGRWFVVRFWKDIAGQEKRTHVRERVCPISGPRSPFQERTQTKGEGNYPSKRSGLS